MERFAAAMHLGVGNVRRSRQQAKLSLAQQLFHEKKLSLLKTQHMIELLHKSQASARRELRSGFIDARARTSSRHACLSDSSRGTAALLA